MKKIILIPYLIVFKNNLKMIWKNINTIFSFNNKKSKSQIHINKLVYNGNETTDIEEISNHLNHYFCNVACDINKTINSKGISHMQFMDSPNPKSIFLEAVTKHELSDIIDNLKQNESPGPDNIGPKIVYDSKHLLLDPLTYIYNLSIETGVVPTHLKLAKVLPIYKNGLRTQPSNYRPISMLSVFDKMLERIMYKRFFHFWTNIIF